MSSGRPDKGKGKGRADDKDKADYKGKGKAKATDDENVQFNMSNVPPPPRRDPTTAHSQLVVTNYHPGPENLDAGESVLQGESRQSPTRRRRKVPTREAEWNYAREEQEKRDRLYEANRPAREEEIRQRQRRDSLEYARERRAEAKVKHEKRVILESERLDRTATVSNKSKAWGPKPFFPMMLPTPEPPEPNPETRRRDLLERMELSRLRDENRGPEPEVERRSTPEVEAGPEPYADPLPTKYDKRYEGYRKDHRNDRKRER